MLFTRLVGFPTTVEYIYKYYKKDKTRCEYYSGYDGVYGVSNDTILWLRAKNNYDFTYGYPLALR
jgi:hypothetical protein